MQRWLVRISIAGGILLLALPTAVWLYLPSPAKQDEESYAVRSAILTGWVKNSIPAYQSGKSILAIDAATGEMDDLSGFTYRTPGSPILRLEAKIKNWRSHPVERKFNVPVPYVLTNDIMKFEDEHRSGPSRDTQLLYVQFSAVSFNHNATMALFRIDQTCGVLCGGGHYVLMQKQSGKWIVIDQSELWIS